jgi:putative oxidoreductase
MHLLTNMITRRTAAIDVLRLVLCAIVFTHGAYRFYEGTSPILGQILESHGFPFGTFLAYSVNTVETVGGVLLALRLLVIPVCLSLSTIYITGIILFHRHEGFFVVGPGTGGWEYSALLITCALVTAWENRAQGLKLFPPRVAQQG